MLLRSLSLFSLLYLTDGAFKVTVPPGSSSSFSDDPVPVPTPASPDQGVNASAPLNPVFLMPGILGTGLFAELDKANIPSCSKTSNISYKPYRVWASASAIRPPFAHQQCWVDTMSLSWAPTKKEAEENLRQGSGLLSILKKQFLRRWRLRSLYYSAEEPGGWYYSGDGVQIAPEEGAKGIEYLDYISGLGVPFLRYFHDLMVSLQNKGYEREKSLFAVPYDWRLPMWQMPWEEIRGRIEKAVVLNNNKRAILVAHSLGTISFNYFLNKIVDKEWKRQYVQAFVVISGAFGGSPKPMRALISGYDPVDMSFFHWLEISLMPSYLLKTFSRNLGSIFTLVPQRSVFGANRVFVYVTNDSTNYATTGKAYSLSNWTELLVDDPRALEKQHLAKKLEGAALRIWPYSLEDPEVPVYCYWSVFDMKDTESAFIYDENSIDKDPVIIRDYGDGSLPIESLKYCTSWTSIVEKREFRNIDHVKILRDLELVNTVTSAIVDDAPTRNIREEELWPF